MSKLLDIEKSAQRDVKSGLQYDSLFPEASILDKVVLKDGGVRDTIKTMQEIVLKYLDDTRLVAPTLKGKILRDTCRNIWDFLYSHYQYKLDEAGLEQLRRPARAWHDRFKGVDCDCFSISASSILTNLDIPHALRITKYLDKNGVPGDWQHVYVIAHKPNGGHYTIDPVSHHFDYEKPYHNKIDYKMTQLNGIPIAILSGLSEVPSHGGDSGEAELYGILSGADFEEVERLDGLGELPDDDEGALNAIYNHLVHTRDYIEKNPASVITSGGAEANLQMLGYAIDNWHTPNRDNALDILEQEEERWNEHSGVMGLDGEDDEEFNGLGAPKAKKKFFSKVKQAVKAVTKKVGTAVKKVGAAAKTVVKKAGGLVKKAVKAVVRFNPLSIAVRGGFLLAMKINLLDMASKIYPAYFTEAQAKAKGITSDKWQKAKTALARIEKIFVSKLQGKSDNLKKAIMNGRAAKQFKGFGELGEPATIATVVAASVPLIAAYNEIRKAGLQGLGADTEMQPTETEKKNFIQRVREWWRKTFGKETATATETISDAENQTNTDLEITEGSTEDASSSSSDPGGSSSDTSTSSGESGDESSEDAGEDGEEGTSSTALIKTEGGKTPVKNPTAEGGWSKIKTFAKANPMKAAVGGMAAAAVVTGIVLGIKHFIKKPKGKSSASVGLAGYKKKKRRRNKQAKTIILK